MLALPLTYLSALLVLACTNALVLPQMPGRDIHIERLESSAVRALERQHTVPRSPECVACIEGDLLSSDVEPLITKQK
ncbi:hypothetical protein C8R44DRAFT_865940 [Mycena epipterygia]|nr:hypothetical protein C8R44DRAFT_865940 [Mycena epipterygia]